MPYSKYHTCTITHVIIMNIKCYASLTTHVTNINYIYIKRMDFEAYSNLICVLLKSMYGSYIYQC